MWMVEAMLDLVKNETERIDSRFLEPACGSGNLLVRILRRKLAAVELRYCKSDFERRHYAILVRCASTASSCWRRASLLQKTAITSLCRRNWSRGTLARPWTGRLSAPG